jgi:octaprenyl-diphosphate synthase
VTAELLGKNIGDDLREGKPTLPLLLAMKMGSAEQRSGLACAILHGETEHLQDIVEQIQSNSGALDATREAAEGSGQWAAECLSCLPRQRMDKSSARIVAIRFGGALFLSRRQVEPDGSSAFTATVGV